MNHAAVSVQMHAAVAWLRDALELSASEDGEVEDLKERLAAMEKQRAEVDSCMEATYNHLKAELDQCRQLIDALRRQIKETKDALELDDSKFQDIKANIQAETADRQKHLESRVKLATVAPTETKGGRVKLRAGACPPKSGAPVLAASCGKTRLEIGAMEVDGNGMLSKQELQSKLRNMGWSLEEAEKTFKGMDRDGDGGISANEYAAFCQMEDKNLQLGTLNGIAILRQLLANLQAKLAAFASKDASKDAEIQDLRKRLAEEKRKEEELETDLKRTKVCAEDEGG
jgi:chromosome segregation ATPase